MSLFSFLLLARRPSFSFSASRACLSPRQRADWAALKFQWHIIMFASEIARTWRPIPHFWYIYIYVHIYIYMYAYTYMCVYHHVNYDFIAYIPMFDPCFTMCGFLSPIHWCHSEVGTSGISLRSQAWKSVDLTNPIGSFDGQSRRCPPGTKHVSGPRLTSKSLTLGKKLWRCRVSREWFDSFDFFSMSISGHCNKIQSGHQKELSPISTGSKFEASN